MKIDNNEMEMEMKKEKSSKYLFIIIIIGVKDIFHLIYATYILYTYKAGMLFGEASEANKYVRRFSYPPPTQKKKKIRYKRTILRFSIKNINICCHFSYINNTFYYIFESTIVSIYISTTRHSQ